jgi:hypothetical protein
MKVTNPPLGSTLCPDPPSSPDPGYPEVCGVKDTSKIPKVVDIGDVPDIPLVRPIGTCPTRRSGFPTGAVLV